jgi:hypothetical protein
MRLEARTPVDHPDKPVPGGYGDRSRPRGGALGLTILLHLLAAVILLLQRAVPVPMLAEQGLNTFNLPAAKDEGETPEAATQAKESAKAPAAREEAPEAPEPPPPPPPIPTTPSEPRPNPWLELSSSEMAQGDIAKLRNAKAASSGAEAGADSRAASGPGAGAGPGGAALYPADWYREPTSTELGGYLRPGMPRSGWGQIACRTVARYHVEDCYIIGESPRGSGFGRAVLDAAWQFLVMPPRINGKAQVGTWVTIRITYTPAGVNIG